MCTSCKVQINGKGGQFSVAEGGQFYIAANKQDRREIADFFVVRKFKRFGVGKTIAFLALDTHPGRWTIRVLDGNTGARAFWTKVVDEYTGSDFILSDEQFEDANSGVWNMQFYRFDSRIS
jgi:predicted acetyltransferase